jgi:hypothetical protein
MRCNKCGHEYPLRQVVTSVVGFVECLETEDRDYDSTQLLLAARRFAGVVEVYLQRRAREEKQP